MLWTALAFIGFIFTRQPPKLQTLTYTVCGEGQCSQADTLAQTNGCLYEMEGTSTVKDIFCGAYSVVKN